MLAVFFCHFSPSQKLINTQKIPVKQKFFLAASYVLCLSFIYQVLFGTTFNCHNLTVTRPDPPVQGCEHHLCSVALAWDLPGGDK